MRLRNSTVKRMLDIMECSLNGQYMTLELEKLLNHEDYRIQFDFFENHPAGIAFSPNDFIKMFHSIYNYSPSPGTSKALTKRREDFILAFEKNECLKESLHLLEKFNEEDLKLAVELANEGLLLPFIRKTLRLL
ncbi:MULTISPECIES: hypothetical protein [unclassified Fusibacter]|uniref:hypothetical protein n=1 Tax=unclassified Fusibacter TaxID=2624464 RepID=UPI001011D5B0|nr:MULTISPECIES: hypothetical protein [unclassified Fusibacter]MCK8061481.1 hypothetical protein [Fusibacter sp. A2]NPE23666.1 hypothetical protein [Fusibacter sp. A1]RXV58845.1 hypothetical protein DWB64_17930 [Fusibacter sp. A1]